MKKGSKRLLALAVTAAIGFPAAANATNGMDMEGYGPIATGMGGASMAYDNGTAAMMNNPATLGLMAKNSSRFDIALGFLGPDVSTTVPTSVPGGSGRKAKSSADSFYMPAIGYANNNGAMTWGVGVFAQGGMGTEYGADSDLALGSGQKVRSELGVARLMLPLAYEVNDNFVVGGSIDFVRATLDLKMAVPSQAFMPASSGGMVTGMSPGWQTALSSFSGATWGRFDFSDNSDYSGKATGYGFAGKLGFTYKIAPNVTIGGSYQSETSLGDLETSSSGATISAGNVSSTGTPTTLGTISGKIKVKDFQWPNTYALGVSYLPTDSLMLVADVKQIQWSEVMKNFKMSFSNDTYGSLDVALPQNWKDQTVVELGVAYKTTDALTLRAGYNTSTNPIPDETVSPLFPAIIKDHYTLGLGYAVTDASDVNFSYTIAPEVKVTGSGPFNGGTEITHSQQNWQLMYSQRF